LLRPQVFHHHKAAHAAELIIPGTPANHASHVKRIVAGVADDPCGRVSGAGALGCLVTEVGVVACAPVHKTTVRGRKSSEVW